MKFEDIEKQTKEDLVIDRFDLTEESLRTPKLFSKYLYILRNEKLVLKNLNNMYDTLYLQKREYYSGEAPDSVYEEAPWEKKVLRQDLDIYIRADKDIQNLTDRIANQEQKIDCLEKTVSMIEKRTYMIRDAIEYLKFTQGT